MSDGGFGSGSQGADSAAGDTRPDVSSGDTSTNTQNYDVASGTFSRNDYNSGQNDVNSGESASGFSVPLDSTADVTALPPIFATFSNPESEFSTSTDYFKQYGFNSPLGPSSGFPSFEKNMTDAMWANIAADTYGIPRNIFNGLVTQESTWQHYKNGKPDYNDPNFGLVTSGEKYGFPLGYTQITAKNGAALGFNVTDPIQNFFAGASYLNLMKQGLTVTPSGDFVRVNNPAPSWQIALARYNSIPQTNSDIVGYGASVLGHAAVNNGYPVGKTPGTVITETGAPSAPASAFPTVKTAVHTGFRIPFTNVRIGGPSIISVDEPSGGSTPVVSAPDVPSKKSVEAAVIKAAFTQPSPVAVSGSGAATGASGDTSGLDTTAPTMKATNVNFLNDVGNAVNSIPLFKNLFDPLAGSVINQVAPPGTVKPNETLEGKLSIDWQAYLPVAFVGLLAVLFLTVGVKSLTSE